MAWVALRMLTGDRSKYLGLIFGVTFATLLMAQQVSIFMGVLTRTGNQIREVRDADIWVMDNRVRYLDEAPGLRDADLVRVRGVPGVAWAVRWHRGLGRAQLEDGRFQQVILLGLDDDSLAGAPRTLLRGRDGAFRLLHGKARRRETFRTMRNVISQRAGFASACIAPALMPFR